MISIQLRNLRREKKLTQVELAKILNVSNGTVAMWETNKREPDLEMVNKIASYFNVSIDFLLGSEKAINNFLQEDNTITIFGRGKGAKRYKVSQKKLQAIQALLEDDNGVEDNDEY